MKPTAINLAALLAALSPRPAARQVGQLPVPDSGDADEVGFKASGQSTGWGS